MRQSWNNQQDLNILPDIKNENITSFCAQRKVYMCKCGHMCDCVYR